MAARYRRDPDFINRPELALLEDKMPSPGARVALVGLGGIGFVAHIVEFEHFADCPKKVAACNRVLLPCPGQSPRNSSAVVTRKQRSAFRPRPPDARLRPGHSR